MAQSDDLTGEVAVGRQVDFGQDLVDVRHTVLVGDDVKLDGNGAVDEDPLQGLDVAETTFEKKWTKMLNNSKVILLLGGGDWVDV